MARKKLHEEHENHERWLISYADFITLLFAFFVVMYAISSVNEGKYRVLSDALVAAFRQPQKALKPIQIGEPAKSPLASQMDMQNRPSIVELPRVAVPQVKPTDEPGQRPQHLPEDAAATGAEQGARDIAKIADDVEQALSHLVGQGLVSVRRSDLWIEVEIKDSVLFPSGSARLQSGAVPLLEDIARILRDFANPIRVEGFTDNVPISTLVYPSNWELSAARAASVVRLFAGAGISPVRLAALGYGEHRPIAENATAEGRARNRRVVMVVLADREVEQLLERRIEAARRRPPEPAPVPVPVPEPAPAAVPAAAPVPEPVAVPVRAAPRAPAPPAERPAAAAQPRTAARDEAERPTPAPRPQPAAASTAAPAAPRAEAIPPRGAVEIPRAGAVTLIAPPVDLLKPLIVAPLGVPALIDLAPFGRAGPDLPAAAPGEAGRRGP